jgi:hypothetical protein
MQRFAVESGGSETGIMLDYVPSGTEYHEIEEGPRHDRPSWLYTSHLNMLPLARSWRLRFSRT